MEQQSKSILLVEDDRFLRKAAEATLRRHGFIVHTAADGEEALGGGDVYLAGILGLMLGSRFIINGLVYGILLGGLIGVLLLVAFQLRRNRSGEALMTFIPYGPFLIAGAFIMLFLG